MLRYFSADYIFPISSPPIKNGFVAIDNNGVIAETGEVNTHTAPLLSQTYKGIICPGFINTHCHLELSHMKGIIPEKIGMAGFIKNMIARRPNYSSEKITKAIVEAEKEMIENGIVAVGDISNDDSTFLQKSKGNLKYHTFFEVFDINPNKADEVIEKATRLRNQLNATVSNSQSSIVPHASYTVSPRLFELIRTNAEINNSIISYHNQESLAESELFSSNNGNIAKLFAELKIELRHISKTNLNSLRSTLHYFSPVNKTLLVHNTFSTIEDILFAENYFKVGDFNLKQIKSSTEKNGTKLFWCFCPNANMYIENKLPDYNLFINAGAQCTIGTDSLASNHSLSVLEELKTITMYVPHLPLQTLLTWATLNGARALGFSSELGSLEKGKRPGLNLITDYDLRTLSLRTKSKVKKLI
ncbi:MAG: amidohydrolase family protein [Bacteroidia bacterium]|nr:amidohydrolase family protein [Bacteroidia bacterium]